ncbi:chitinase [Streptomyces albofaciens JCM 4342]|uniref:chitinase n=1 Tax=Streptomyces albofaciens TaxID=66866 RepID=UPI0012383E4D|nr:chitinase [Streptomyces albofaciens]KAA6214272.1 chitinase [Streptomyces albofaciens JCM 4342]
MVRARSGRAARSGRTARRRARTLAGLAAAALTAAGVVAAGTADASEATTTATSAASRTGHSPTVARTAAVPKHAVTGYWQNFDNGATVQKLKDVNDAYDIIAVSFAEATGTPGAVDFHLDPAVGYGSADAFKADVKAKQAAGKSVIISVGGEKGAVAVADDASAKNFADSVGRLMDEYGFDGVDIDLENGLNSTYMTKALKALHAAHSGVVVTMAPQTVDMQSPRNEYFKTALAIKDFLTVVNMQYYNSGSMNGCDGKVYAQGTVDFLTSLACVQLAGGLAPSQVGIGVPASSRAAGGGYVAPSVVNAALDCLTKGEHCGAFKPPKKYPELRGAMAWSTNWDAANGNAFAAQVGAHVHKLP